MWKYNITDDLYHYGVKGMKWGVRRYNRISEKVKTGEKKREDILKTKRYDSNAYIKKSRKLYLDKARLSLAKAKMKGSIEDIEIAKDDVKTAKIIKKYGTNGPVNFVNKIKRSVYGEKLTNKQIEHLSNKDYKSFIAKYNAKKVSQIAAKSALGVIGAIPVAVYVARNRFLIN